jgi:D-beta-D-heptose 7-phosphate kinase/D-beta-D-heptose 1-phosphate adenosyltransferase
VSPDLIDLPGRLRGRTILVVGDVMLDRYWWGTVERTSPEAPVPVVRKHRASRSPGGAANVAANVAGMDGRALLVGLVGDDEAGRELVERLAQHGVAGDHLVVSSKRPTTVKTRIVAHNQHVVRVDEEAVRPADELEAKDLLARMEPLIAASDAVVFSDYAKGALSVEVVTKGIAMARALGRPVLVDPKGLDYGRYAGAAVVVPNLLEATTAAGLARDEPGGAERAGALLLERLDVAALLITQGEQGMTLFRRSRERVKLPARARAVYDVTGAGDTVMAALALAVAAGADLVVAAQIANVAAGIAVEQVATTVVTGTRLAQAVAGQRGEPIE